jgi:hypothetical protein
MVNFGGKSKRKSKRNPNAEILAAWRKHVKSVATRENMNYGKAMKKAKMGKYGEEWEKNKKSMGKVKKGGDIEEPPSGYNDDVDEEEEEEEEEEDDNEEDDKMNGGKRRRRRKTMRRSRKRGTRRRKTRRRRH